MDKFLHNRRFSPYFGQDEKTGEYLLMLMFALGICCGVLWASRYGGGSHYIAAADISCFTGGALQCLWRSTVCLILCLVFATSFLGILLIPALAFARGCGFALSCVLVTCAARAETAVLAVVIPGLLSIPAFLLCAQDCFAASGFLCRCRSGSFYPRRCQTPARRLTIIFLAALTFIYDFRLLPILLKKF